MTPNVIAIALLILVVDVHDVTCEDSAVTENRFFELEKFVQLQQKKIGDLETKIASLEEKNVELNEVVSRFGIWYNSSNGGGILADKLTPTGENDPPLANVSILQRKRRAAGQVAFDSYLSGGCNYANKVIVFDVETLDTVGAYDPSNGIFVAPVTGVYVFVWHVVATYREYFVSELLVNGFVRGRTMTDAQINGGTGIHPATGVSVVHLLSGNKVSVRRATSYGCNIASTAQAHNTFSGWLLFEH